MANNGRPQGQQRAPSNAQRREPVATPPAAPVVEEAVKAPVDTVVLATPAPAPEPIVEAPVVEEPVVETVVMQSLVVTEEDDEQVVMLKTKLADFVEAAGKLGSEPEDFKGQAKQALMIAKFVTQYPKVNVLDALTAFFEENIKGVCDSKTFLKGTDTLSMTDARLVGYLHSIFADIARKQNVGINAGMVTQVFKKPEIANYFNRRVAAFANGN